MTPYLWVPKQGVDLPTSPPLFPGRTVERYSCMPSAAVNAMIPLKAAAIVGGGEPPLNPLSWWDPEIEAFQDTAATTPATANNDPVARLDDQEASNNVTNAAGTTRPLLKTNVVNGHSALQFDGSNDYLNALFTLADPVSIYMCVRIDTWVNNRYLVGPGTGDNFDVFMSGSSPNINTWMGSGTGTVNTNLVVGTFAILAVIFDNGGGKKITRVNAGSPIGTGSGDGNAGGVTFAAHPGFSSYGAVTIARMAIYNVSHNDANETIIRNSFNARYACF